MSDKTCDNCGKSENLKPFDLTGRVFCNLDCFKKFYESKNESQILPTEELSAIEIKSIEEHENQWCASLSDGSKPIEHSLKTLENRILALRGLQKEYRLRELIARKHVLKINSANEAGKVERYRKYGVNSDAERTAQKLNITQKEILRYKKMGMSADKVCEIMEVISDWTRDMIKNEYNKLS